MRSPRGTLEATSPGRKNDNNKCPEAEVCWKNMGPVGLGR